MDNLKKHGFTIALAGMVVVLAAFAYLFVMEKVNRYNEKAGRLRTAAARLKKYASMKVEELPTAALVKLRQGEKDSLEAAEAEGEDFYKTKRQKLQELRFQPDGEVFDPDDEAGISNAFQTAITQLNQEYLKVKNAYVDKVYPADRLKGIERNFPPIQIAASFTTPEERIDAAEKCHIARAIFKAAEASGWGGMTSIAFERRRQAETRKKATTTTTKSRSSSRSSRSSTRGRRGRRAKKKAAPKEVKPVDPRSLYEKIKVKIAGEIRFRDVGPFLGHIYAQARDEKNPVLFFLEELTTYKQGDRLLDPLYKSTWDRKEDAESAPLDKEVRVPTATVRMTLSVLRWKGFPQEEQGS